MKHVCLIKWRSNYLILKLDTILWVSTSRKQCWNRCAVSLFVKKSVNVGVGNTKKKDTERLHSDSRFFQCKKLKDWKLICRISKTQPLETSIHHIVFTHLESWRSHFLCLSTNDIKERVFVYLLFYL